MAVREVRPAFFKFHSVWQLIIVTKLVAVSFFQNFFRENAEGQSLVNRAKPDINAITRGSLRPILTVKKPNEPIQQCYQIRLFFDNGGDEIPGKDKNKKK